MNRPRTALVAIVALVGALVGVTGTQSADASDGCPPPIAIAHRGDNRIAPENTGPAFAAALKGGAKVIEMDIRFTKSNVAVVMHDATVDRTTNGTGPVSGYWLSTLQKLDAGSSFNAGFAGTRVPTFGAALRIARPFTGAMALPELKGTPTDAQLDIIAKAISDNGMTGRVVVQSFSSTALNRMKKRHPTIPLAYLTTTSYTDPTTAVRAAKANYWMPKASTVTNENVDLAHASGIKVWPWTSNTPDEWVRLSEAGVDAILTDSPTNYVGWFTSRCGIAP